jgi:tetratricopeptide (TPR) repeat protein
MNSQPANVPCVAPLVSSGMLNFWERWSAPVRIRIRPCTMFSAVIYITLLLLPAAVAQNGTLSRGGNIEGTVSTFDGKPVGDVAVHLVRKDSTRIVETKTDAAGSFAFSSLSSGDYGLSAEKAGLHSRTIDVTVSDKDKNKVDLVLPRPALTVDPASGTQTMEFADKPNFTVAGVMDWTAVGGHGSDSTLRTSESLASETAMLKPDSATTRGSAKASDTSSNGESESKLRARLANSPRSFDANHQLGEFYLHAGRQKDAIPLLESAYCINPASDENRYALALAYEANGDLSKARERTHELLADGQSADLHRVMGDLDEKAGDPLSAVREYQRAAELSPTEQNYFKWGSELLLHRAVWQAQEVFRKAAQEFPKSARIQTALGTALFAGARYDEAALHVCAASDLNPEAPGPYIFLGKIQMAAPNSLACVEPKLARFVGKNPESPIANYLYAMSILKHHEQSADKQASQQVEALLTKAVMLDPKCSEAYLQLGIMAASQRNFDKAIGLYGKAIEADPQLADAHYRLAMAYDRTGESAKAKQELQLHNQIKQQQAEETERQRREIKQFIIGQPGESAHSETRKLRLN